MSDYYKRQLQMGDDGITKRTAYRHNLRRGNINLIAESSNERHVLVMYYYNIEHLLFIYIVEYNLCFDKIS